MSGDDSGARAEAVGQAMGCGGAGRRAGVAGVGLYWFQPWKLWVDETVRDEIPTAITTPDSTPAAGTPTEPTAGKTAPAPPSGPRHRRSAS
jgi:hypothetical protein